MENKIQDEYVVIINRTKTKYYYKNGMLHRETGPAIIHKSNKDKYSDLPDEHLYKLIEVDTFLPKGFSPVYVSEELEDSSRVPYRPARYYLNGQPYSKKDFEKIKAQLDLKNKLSEELSEKQTNNKRVKI